MKRPAHILPLIIISQFAGTSLWFAVNAILPEILNDNHSTSVGTITSVVQFGFITGTLIFAIFSIADRFSPSIVFFISSVIASLTNGAVIWASSDVETLYVLRFTTGFFLAGIYPVGMKIASDWYEKGLGKALGFLVGALVLGTAFPNLLKSHLIQLQWKEILVFTSVFAFGGGLLVLFFVGDGPYKKTATRFQPYAIIKVFQSPDFRSASFGYFGHMWELYTFWSFVPIMILTYNTQHTLSSNIYLASFFIIAIGSLSCVAGGYLAEKISSSRVAFISLVISGICCLFSFCLTQLPELIFYSVMIIWGISVIADSPQFSTLIAQTAPPEYKGTALTIVTSIGFAITIVSIQLLTSIFNSENKDFFAFVALSPGPLLGLIYLWRLAKNKK